MYIVSFPVAKFTLVQYFKVYKKDLIIVNFETLLRNYHKAKNVSKLQVNTRALSNSFPSFVIGRCPCH